MTPRAIGAIAIGLACVTLAGERAAVVSTDELEGIAPGDTKLVPAVEAAFERESYRPGQRARLVIHHRSRALTMQVFESGPERVPTLSDTVMNGVPVTRERSIGKASGRRVLTVRIGRWDSGLYFARLRAADGRLGFAPFVVAPPPIGGRSSCRRSRGRPTTSGMTTATASRTPGTPTST